MTKKSKKLIKDFLSVDAALEKSPNEQSRLQSTQLITEIGKRQDIDSKTRSKLLRQYLGINLD